MNTTVEQTIEVKPGTVIQDQNGKMITEFQAVLVHRNGRPTWRRDIGDRYEYYEYAVGKPKQQ